jgi:hypothetical protein
MHGFSLSTTAFKTLVLMSYDSYNAWAVMDGDIANVVPIPAAVYLFASGLGLLGWFRRKASY